MSRPQQLRLPLAAMCHGVVLTQYLSSLECTACPLLSTLSPPVPAPVAPAVPCRIACMSTASRQDSTTPQLSPPLPCTVLRSLCRPAERPQAGDLSLHVLQSRQACRGEQHACGASALSGCGLLSDATCSVSSSVSCPHSLGYLCSLLCCCLHASCHLRHICVLVHSHGALHMSAVVGHAGGLSCSAFNVRLQVKSKHPDIKFGEVGKKLGELKQGSFSDHLSPCRALLSSWCVELNRHPYKGPQCCFDLSVEILASRRRWEAASAVCSLIWPTYFGVPHPLLLCFLQARCGSRSHQQRRRSMRTRQLRTRSVLQKRRPHTSHEPPLSV